MAASVEELLQNNPARLWRAREQGAASAMPAGLPTGYAALDCCLPGQGWPRQGLIEILSDQRGIGELRLLMPALAQLCSRPRATVPGKARPAAVRGGGWVAWVSPPYTPYAPALASWGIDVARMLVVHGTGATEWAMDQALRSEACSAVLGWTNPRDMQALRRLQLAAEQSHSLAVLFRPLQAGLTSSPAVLRLALLGDRREGTQVRIVKSRGGRPATVSLGH
ncbi:MAG TPA: translesion DNA synthesis-associated protein ImuA [Steroidobacteraceae bacterium]|nr:translesion DNA synthesis-associated protein ImuA [Steroidobacteraceae bacterium]